MENLLSYTNEAILGKCSWRWYRGQRGDVSGSKEEAEQHWRLQVRNDRIKAVQQIQMRAGRFGKDFSKGINRT